MGRQKLGNVGERSPDFAYPESQMVDCLVDYDSLPEPPMSRTRMLYDFTNSRDIDQKLWRNENSSLKDGLYSGVDMDGNVSNPSFERYGDGEISGTGNGDRSEVFSRVLRTSSKNGVTHSAPPSPRRSNSRLIHSLYDLNGVISNYSEKQAKMFRSPASSQLEWNPNRKYERHGFSHHLNYEDIPNENLPEIGEPSRNYVFESMRPTGVIYVGNDSFETICCFFIVLLPVLLSLIWIVHQEKGSYLVPT